MSEKSVLVAKSHPRGPKEGSRVDKALQSAEEGPGEPQGRRKSRQAQPPRAPQEGLLPPREKPQERPWSLTAIRPQRKEQEETRADKTSGRTRQQADKRSSGATKPRTPWPVSNLLLVHVVHGSTLVYVLRGAGSFIFFPLPNHEIEAPAFDQTIKKTN